MITCVSDLVGRHGTYAENRVFGLFSNKSENSLGAFSTTGVKFGQIPENFNVEKSSTIRE